MITGTVSFRQILLNVPFHLPNQSAVAIEFVVDTGFTGFLALPQEATEALGLSFNYEQEVRLANDLLVRSRIYDAIVMWNGIEREVYVLAAGKRPLLGTAMLEGNELFAQFREGGMVSIDAM